MLGVEYLLTYVSTKNKSEKIAFYFTFFLIRTGCLISDYHWIEKNISFHLTYNTVFYYFWFLSYKGKSETTPAPVLSILKKGLGGSGVGLVLV